MDSVVFTLQCSFFLQDNPVVREGPEWRSGGNAGAVLHLPTAIWCWWWWWWRWWRWWWCWWWWWWWWMAQWWMPIADAVVHSPIASCLLPHWATFSTEQHFRLSYISHLEWATFWSLSLNWKTVCKCSTIHYKEMKKLLFSEELPNDKDIRHKDEDTSGCISYIYTRVIFADLMPLQLWYEAVSSETELKHITWNRIRVDYISGASAIPYLFWFFVDLNLMRETFLPTLKLS